MLRLDSPAWADLSHAYGSAADIPPLLAVLARAGDRAAEEQAWFDLWSALAHQGDVYDASFAAVPHVVRILAHRTSDASPSFLNFPAWVEICRAHHGLDVPSALAPAYRAALREIPEIVARVADRAWDYDMLASALAAMAAAKGHPTVAEAVLELNPAVAREFVDWFSSR